MGLQTFSRDPIEKKHPRGCSGYSSATLVCYVRDRRTTTREPTLSREKIQSGQRRSDIDSTAFSWFLYSHIHYITEKAVPWLGQLAAGCLPWRLRFNARVFPVGFVVVKVVLGQTFLWEHRHYPHKFFFPPVFSSYPLSRDSIIDVNEAAVHLPTDRISFHTYN